MSVETEGSISEPQHVVLLRSGHNPALTLGEQFGKTVLLDGHVISRTLLPDFMAPLCHFLDYGAKDVLFNLCLSFLVCFMG